MKKYKNKKLNIDIPEILSIKKTLIFNNNISKNELNISNLSSNVQNINVSIPPETKNSNTDINENVSVIKKTNEITNNKIKDNSHTFIENTNQQNIKDSIQVQTVVKNSKNEINDNNDLIDISTNTSNNSSNNSSKISCDTLSHSIIIDINDISNEPSKTSI
jgi:hypothetical protein